MIMTNSVIALVPCADASERSTILQFLLSQGYRWHGYTNYGLDKINAEYPYRKWCVLQLDNKAKKISGRRYSDDIHTIILPSDFIAIYGLQILPADEASNISADDEE